MSPKSDRNSMEYSRGKGEVVDMILLSKFDGTLKNYAASANKTEERSIDGKIKAIRAETQLTAIDVTATPQTSFLIAERRVVIPD